MTLIMAAASALDVSAAQYTHNNMHNPTTTHITQIIKQQHATHKHFTLHGHMCFNMCACCRYTRGRF